MDTLSRRRQRRKQTTSLKDRLDSFAKEVRAKASLLPPGAEQDELLKRARRADVAAHIDAWANSPGLLPPI